MFTNRRTIMQAAAGAVTAAALALTALTGATPAAHAAAARTPGYGAATMAAPPARSAWRSPSGAVIPADQGWYLFATGPSWDWLGCYEDGAAGEALGLWSDYQCTEASDGLQLWVLVNQAQ